MTIPLVVKDGNGAAQTLQLNTNGPAAMADSRSVTIATDQTAIPVTIGAAVNSAQSGAWNVGITNASLAITAAALPLPTGAATQTTLASIDGKTPAIGARLDDVASRPVVLSNQDYSQLGAIKTAVDAVTTAVNAGGVTPGTAGTPATDVLTVQGTGVSSTPVLVHARQGTGSIYSGDTACTPKFAKIAASASGATTVVAAVASKKLRVLGYYITGNGAVNVNLQSHATTATASGLDYIAAAGGGLSVGYSPLGWFETVAGEALDINLSAAVAVGGQLLYIEV